MLSALSMYNWLTVYADNGVSRTMAAYVAGEFSPSRYRKRLMEKGHMIWVVEHRRRLAGFAEVLLRAPHKATTAATSIDKFYLHSAFDDSETRTALFQHVMKELDKYNITNVWLAVWQKQKDRLQFYDTLGFQQVGEFFLEIDGAHLTHYVLDNVPSTP